MFSEIAVILFALTTGYFVSRVLLRTAWFPAGDKGLRWVHVASALGLIVANLLLKFPFDGYNRTAPLLIAVIQLVWYMLDRLRSRHPGSTVGG